MNLPEPDIISLTLTDGTIISCRHTLGEKCWYINNFIQITYSTVKEAYEAYLKAKKIDEFLSKFKVISVPCCNYSNKYAIWNGNDIIGILDVTTDDLDTQSYPAGVILSRIQCPENYIGESG